MGSAPAVKKNGGEFEVGVGHGQQQRACTGTRAGTNLGEFLARQETWLHGLVGVDAGFQQGPNNSDVAFAHGEQKRRISGIDTRLQVGARVEQAPTASPLPSAAAHIRAVWPRSRLTGVDVGAGGDERLHGFEFAGAGGRHQHRLAAGQSSVGVGARLSSSSTIGPLPLVQASESGVTP